MARDFPSEIRLEGGERPEQTLSGLLMLVIQKAREIKFFETLANGLDVSMKVYRYRHIEKLETIVSGIVVGCRHTSEIQAKLVPDTVAAGLFGMARFPDQAQINAFLRAFGPKQVEHLEKAHLELLCGNSRSGERRNWTVVGRGRRVLALDLDQTPIATKSKRATGTAYGYMGRKRSQFGYQKSVAFLGGGVKEVLWQRLDAGNVHAQEAVPSVLEYLEVLRKAKGIGAREVLVRGDSQYGSAGTLRKLQAGGYHYLVKGYTPNTAKQLAESLPETGVWRYGGIDSYGSRLWIAEAGEQELHGHDDPVGMEGVSSRVVLLVRVNHRKRTKHGKGAPGQVWEKVVSHEHYLTDLGPEVLPLEEVIEVYNDRATEESFFRAEQDAFGAHYLRTGHKEGEAGFLWLLASTANLLRWVQHSTFSHTPLENAGLTKLVTNAMQIPAQIVRTAQECIIILPRRARLAQQLLSAWMNRATQLPLPLCYSTNPP